MAVININNYYIVCLKQTDLNSLLDHLKIEYNSYNMHIAETFFCLHVNITFTRELKFRQESLLN